MNWPLDPDWHCEICEDTVLIWGLVHGVCRCQSCHVEYSMGNAREPKTVPDCMLKEDYRAPVLWGWDMYQKPIDEWTDEEWDITFDAIAEKEKSEMVNVQDLLRDYRQEYDLQMPAIRKLAAALQKRRERLDALEKEIEAVVVAEGQSERGFGITVTYRSGYTRTSWNTEGLNGYAVAHPQILTFRKETDVKPTVAMKVTE